MPGTAPNGGKRKVFRKASGKRTLAVVAEVKQNECWFITAYYES